MERRTKAPARLLATLALVGAFVVVIVVLSNGLGSDDSNDSSLKGKAQSGKTSTKKPGKPKQAAYVVQNGDTLTSISEKTGVDVETIQQLNPDIDPQILNSGQKLKLR